MQPSSYNKMIMRQIPSVCDGIFVLLNGDGIILKVVYGNYIRERVLAVDLDPMTKMWISLIAIGLMAVSAILVTFARMKTKGIIRFILTLIAFFCLLLSLIYGIVAIF
jgi:hypothetical protein